MTAETGRHDARAAHVALALCPGIGPARFATLVEACGTPLGALSAPFAILYSLPGISRAAATAVRQTRVSEGRRILRRVEQLGARVILSGEQAFPAALTTIPDPPPVLFVQGDPTLFDRPAVAVVGSRDHSAYGSGVCRRLAAAAAGAGLTVVSGLARGLDAVAHQAALDAGGSTIGVLGNGLGVVYPAANRQLYERVGRGEGGLLMTEFPPGERPRAGSFPRRNRLISGLAAVTVVVEAAQGSGALITVGCALDQGRDVMAVPGAITSATSVGANRLIRDGATPLLEPDDLLAMYTGIDAAIPPPPLVPARLERGALSPEAQRVYDYLEPTPVQLDELAERLAQPVGPLLSLLSALEIAGVVQQLPGHLFTRVR